MGNHPCEKFPQKNYNGEDILHSNRQRSESSMALGEEIEALERVPCLNIIKLIITHINFNFLKLLVMYVKRCNK